MTDTTENRCLFCKWNYNGICCCDGLKPCQTLIFTDKTDYKDNSNSV